MSGARFHAGEYPLPLPSGFVRFFPFDDGGVLFFEGTRRVWGLNASAAFLWCSLGDIRRFDELVKALAEKFSLEESTAMRDVATTLICFEEEGLLGEGRPVDLPEEAADPDIPFSAPFLTEPQRWPVREFFQTPNHIIEFRSQDTGAGAAFVRYMAHLSLDRPVRTDTCLAVVENSAKETWDIYLNGRRFVEGAAGSLLVAPFPMPMSIKPGSEEALKRYYPDLASSAVHYRADGKRVRYLSPPPAGLAGIGSRATVDAIVYPLYLERAQTGLAPIARIDALQRLATTGSSDRKFLCRDIEAMLALVEQTPSFELVFSNLEEALEPLEELIHG